MNPVIEQLERVIAKYGSALPPIEEREPLWQAAANARDEPAAQEIIDYVEKNQQRIHEMLRGEIVKAILY